MSRTQSLSRERSPRFTESLGQYPALLETARTLNEETISFPGQEHVAGNSKIPSIMYYDRNGAMQVAGAEAENASTVAIAEDEGWVKAELYVRTMCYCSSGRRAHHAKF